ncbi:hypothetical protein KVV02_002031 [Mortierella alpina]|uniref:Cytochrome b mRNA-processing protein 4 n=1 Tax=Mortierella alpina TaxID=64518 RepID=A0A9P8CZ46_MORAP|nr:hypothetical protein KVV02_002031 [Mortierella alpina]
MSNYPKAFAVGFGIVGLGYTLMLTTVPTEEQLYEACRHPRNADQLNRIARIKLSPELKKQYEQVKADQARRQAFSDVLRQAAADPEPMWIKKKTPVVPAPSSAAPTGSKDQ